MSRATTPGLTCQRQVDAPATYKGVTVDTGSRLDLIVERSVIVELKAVDSIHPVHEAQLLTYLKITGIRKGLPINFNVPMLKQGIKRRVLRSRSFLCALGVLGGEIRLPLE